MIVQKFCSRAARAALLAGILPGASLLTAQLPVRILTPGADFKLEGSKGHADDVPGGRRFRAGAFEDITVRAPIHVPASSSVDNHVRRLIVRFRASAEGPSLTAAELRSGSQVLYRNADIALGGDYSKREIATPPRSANVMIVGGKMVGPEVFIRLTIGFPGGFEGRANPGEFILLGVEAEFLSKSTGVQKMEPSTGAAVLVGQASAPRAASRGVIYAVMENNDLNWYRHDGVGGGTVNWTPSKKVRSGWDVKQTFSGGDGVIYAVMPNNDLMWYRHDGIGDGTDRWAAPNGRKVGFGWAFKQVFSGGAGVIYALNDRDELLWYRHDGRGDGSFKWAAGSGKVVNTGWNFRKLFSAAAA